MECHREKAHNLGGIFVERVCLLWSDGQRVFTSVGSEGLEQIKEKSY